MLHYLRADAVMVNLISLLLMMFVTSFPMNALSDCKFLRTAAIPISVVSIGSVAFAATAATSVNIPTGGNSIANIASDYCRPLTSVTVGNSVRVINEYALYGTFITSIIMPHSVTAIGVLHCCHCYY
jgi:hypothetical protein